MATATTGTATANAGEHGYTAVSGADTARYAANGYAKTASLEHLSKTKDSQPLSPEYSVPADFLVKVCRTATKFLFRRLANSALRSACRAMACAAPKTALGLPLAGLRTGLSLLGGTVSRSAVPKSGRAGRGGEAVFTKAV